MKLMSKRKAFMRNGKKYFITLYNRNLYSQWYKDYNIFQMKWLWDHKMIKWSEPMVNLGESAKQKYIEFTKKGKKWNQWYSCTLKDYLYYYVIYPIKKKIYELTTV